MCTDTEQKMTAYFEKPFSCHIQLNFMKPKAEVLAWGGI